MNTTLELEVLKASDDWVRYNKDKGKIFAKDILLKVRLPLLSDNALNSMSGNMSFSEFDDCVEMLRGVLQNKESFYGNKSSDFYSSRHCGQDMFNIILSGGYDSNQPRQRIWGCTTLHNKLMVKILRS